ncbi:MAG: DUF4263 domain-containing protein [Desulfobacterales bacterium]
MKNIHTPYDQITISQKRATLDEFNSLLFHSTKVTEPEWQSFFEQNPFIFTETIPIKFDSLFPQVRINKNPVDFLFNQSSPSPFFSTTGIIELKRADHTILDIYGDHLGLSQKANRAFTQINDYFDDLKQSGQLIIDKQSIAVGNNKQAFIIIGLEEEIIKKCYNEVLKNKFYNLMPPGFQILTYDHMFNIFKSNTNLPIYFLVARKLITNSTETIDPPLSGNAVNGWFVND